MAPSSACSSNLAPGVASEPPRAARAALASAPRREASAARVHYWFSFDRWLPVEEKDEFELA